MANSDFKFTVHFFAKDGQWRVYADNGDYWGAKTPQDIPGAIAGLMRSQARALTAAAASIAGGLDGPA